MVADWVIEPRTASLVRETPVSRWTNLTVVERHNATGTWSVVGPPRDMLEFANTGAGVVITRNGVVVMSGWITGISPRSDATTVTGVSDFGLLDNRIVFPNPTTDWAHQSTFAYDVRTGAAETVALAYIKANAGSTAYAGSGTYNDRRDPFLTVPTSSGAGATVKTSARFNLLSDLVADIGEAGNLHVDIVQDESAGTRRLLVTVAPIADLRNQVAFGAPGYDLANMAIGDDWAYDLTAPAMTDALVAGGGIGVSRTQVYARDNTARSLWGGRVVEGFVDQQQSTDAVELANAATDALAANSAPVNIGFTVSDTDDVIYRRDWWCGALISGAFFGVPLDNIVREVTTVVEPNSSTPEKVSAAVGTRDASQWATATQRQLIRALRRIRLLEAQ